MNYPSLKAYSKQYPDIQVTQKDLESQDLCIACLEGKHSQAYNKKKATWATRKLEIVYSDLCGPFSTLSISGNKYFILYIDNAT